MIFRLNHINLIEIEFMSLLETLLSSGRVKPIKIFTSFMLLVFSRPHINSFIIRHDITSPRTTTPNPNPPPS
jgi:hypothetical protein